MSKRILAIVLGLMLILGGALAETKAENAGWRMVVDQIALANADGSVALNPSLEILIGRDGTSHWIQAALVNGGANVAAAQLELGSESILASADGANDCLVIDDADTFLNMYELDAATVRALLDETMNDLGADLDEASDLMESAVPGLSIEQLDGHSFAISMEADGVTVSLRVSWEAYDAGKPFDLSGKNPCKYTYREMYPGDGTDIPDALSAAVSSLMMDESIQAALTLFGAPALQM